MTDAKIVLIVEDDAVTAQVMASAFKNHDDAWDIRSVNSLHRAREMVLALRPDAVLLDLGLPDAVGLQTLDPFVGKTALVVLTGSAEGVGRDVMRRGADDYIVKGSATPATVVSRTEWAIERFKRAEEDRHRVQRAVQAGSLNSMVIAEILDAKRLLRTPGTRPADVHDVLDRALAAVVASHLSLPPQATSGALIVDQVLRGIDVDIKRSDAEQDELWAQPDRLVAIVRWFIRAQDRYKSIESIRTQRGRMIIRFKDGVRLPMDEIGALQGALDPAGVQVDEEAGRPTLRILMAPATDPLTARS